MNNFIYIGILAIVVISVLYYRYKEHYSVISFSKVPEMANPVRFHDRKPEEYNDSYYNGYILPSINDNISAQTKFLKGIRDYDINTTLIYTNELKK